MPAIRSSRSLDALVLCALVALAGCAGASEPVDDAANSGPDAGRFEAGTGPHDAEIEPTDEGPRPPPCVDRDGDGFGMDCEPGRDCDDADPRVTNECYRCADPGNLRAGC